MFHTTPNPIFTDSWEKTMLLCSSQPQSSGVFQQPTLTNYCHLLLTKYLTQI